MNNIFSSKVKSYFNSQDSKENTETNDLSAENNLIKAEINLKENSQKIFKINKIHKNE